VGLVERLTELEKLGLLHIGTMPDGEEGIELHALVREPLYREWLLQRGGFWRVQSLETDGANGYIPRGEQALELLEHLVTLLLGADEPAAAYAVLEQRLGGYLHHVNYLGRARRFLTVVRQLYPAVAGVALSDVVWQRRYARLLTWEAETLRVLGQLEAALVTAQRQWPLGSPPLPRRLCQQARVLRALGRLEQAAALATAARQSSCSSFDGVCAAMELGLIQLFCGDPAMCQVHLLDAETLLREEGAPLAFGPEALDLSLWVQRVWARRALCLGHYARARRLLQACRARAEARHSELDGAQCDVLLAELLRRERSYDDAGQTLHRAIAAAGRSGDVETLIHGGLVQGHLRLDTGHLDGAAAAFGPAMSLASEHGFGTYRIDLLIVRGALALRRGDADAAERDARDALAFAAAPGCGYLWGEADALHLLATVLISGRPAPASPRYAEAVTHLSDELELRERMSDPSAHEVRWLLRRLKAP
jgi:tetratricopeptide (TPR) repeat protein